MLKKRFVLTAMFTAAMLFTAGCGQEATPPPMGAPEPHPPVTQPPATQPPATTPGNDPVQQYPDIIEDLKLAAAVAERYFFFTHAGDYEHAWNLIHPDVQNITERQGANAKELYLAANQQPSKKLTDVINAQMLDEYKPRSTQIRVTNVAELTLRFEDGTEQKIHMAKDENGGWGLYWNPETASLE